MNWQQIKEGRPIADLVSVATLLAMLLSVVAWGLKLEGELNAVRAEVFQLQKQVGQGILPRAEERLRSLEQRTKEISDDLDDHDRDHRNL